MKNHPSFITLVNKTVMGHAHRQFAERGVQNPQKHKDMSTDVKIYKLNEIRQAYLLNYL